MSTIHAVKRHGVHAGAKAGKPEPSTAKNTVTLKFELSCEGDVSEAGAQVRTTKKLEPEVSQHALPLSSSSKLSELNVEIVDGNSKRASAGARDGGKCPLRLQTRNTA